MSKYRVSECKYTKHEVLQVRDGDEWLCLHMDTREDEIRDIKNYLEAEQLGEQNEQVLQTKRNR